jgi:Spy/CpxP family protein refolding chaperone
MQRSQGFQKELGLTAEQQQKMEHIRTDFRNRLSSLRSDNALTQEQKKAKMHELMKQQQDQMKALLTPDQIQKMKSAKKQRTKKSIE